MTSDRDISTETNEEDAVPGYRSGAERPGALRGEAWLTVETRQAQRLLTGRRKEAEQPGIIGLTRFAVLLRVLSASARADDPYADWWLLKVHAALEASAAELERFRDDAKARLASVRAIDIAIAHSLEPVRIPLTFSHPYAFRGAYLVADYDETVRAILTARHVGLASALESDRLLERAGRAVRRAFLTVAGYKHFGVTRDDVAKGTARAAEAKALMGELPSAVLEGEQRAPFAPESQGGFRALNPHRLERATEASSAPTAEALTADETRATKLPDSVTDPQRAL